MKVANMRRKLGQAAAVVACVAAVSAWAPEALAQGDANWQKIVAAAKKEGSLVIYHQAVPPVVGRVVKDFMAMYPEIRVEAKRQVMPAQHMAVIENEKKSNIDGADVSQYSNAIWYRDMAKENYFLKPVGPALADYPKEHLLYGAVPIIAVMPFVIAYNTNLVKTPVNNLRDLLRPEFKGKIGTSDIVAETVYACYEWLEKTQGADYLPQLAALQPKLTPGVVPLFQGLAAGELAVAAYGIHAIANPLIAQGAPIKVIQPNPAFVSADVMAAVAHARRPNAALVWMDYIMSRRGQAQWNGAGEKASVILGIPGSLDAKTMQPWDIFR
ncbi:MAG: extracellular solute-binding protein [Betaproteobacteria bacterium]|nr:extracellular solute-binding protein [Betaproteobacteria bacterium]